MAPRGRASAIQPRAQREILSSSPDETRTLAARLARVAEADDFIALYGPLGTGKTEFSKGFAVGLGVREVVNSPSFILMAEHAGRLPLFHLDLFRLTTPQGVIDAGLLDDRRAAGVTLVEWADRLGELLPAEHLAVWIEGSGDEPRRIALVSAYPGYARYIEAADGTTP